LLLVSWAEDAVAAVVAAAACVSAEDATVAAAAADSAARRRRRYLVVIKMSLKFSQEITMFSIFTYLQYSLKVST